MYMAEVIQFYNYRSSIEPMPGSGILYPPPEDPPPISIPERSTPPGNIHTSVQIIITANTIQKFRVNSPDRIAIIPVLKNQVIPGNIPKNSHIPGNVAPKSQKKKPKAKYKNAIKYALSTCLVTITMPNEKTQNQIKLQWAKIIGPIPARNRIPRIVHPVM